MYQKEGLAIGETCEQDRPPAFTGWPIDVGIQNGPISHGGRDIEFDGDLLTRLSWHRKIAPQCASDTRFCASYGRDSSRPAGPLSML